MLATPPDRAYAAVTLGGVLLLRSSLKVAAISLVACSAISPEALAAPASAAAVCADYSNQADAQRAADTRDGDSDGVYCEDLPCPCLRPGEGVGGESPPPPPRRVKREQTIAARVVSVTDGDTIKVRATERTSRRRYTIRVIGIDTPETRRPGVSVECGGPQASASMKHLAPVGTRVVLRTDPTQDTFDRYDRLLAYVRRGRRDLGRTQISRGWAKTYVYGGKPFQRTAAYRRSERKARRLGRGVHGRCGGDFHSEQSRSSIGSRAVTARCRAVSYGGRAYVLYYHGMTCTTARRRVRHVHRYRRLRGWRCSSGSRFRTGGYCRRSARYFGWHPGD